jgi:protein SCO1/2
MRLVRAPAQAACTAFLGALASLLLLFFDTSTAQTVAAADPHAHHHHAAADTVRSTVTVQLPDVALTRADGKAVSLRDEIDDGRPVVVSFVYTTCTTICPVTSQVLSELQAKLGPRRDRVHLVSISIDPEQDTPARLRAYAQKFGAGSEWQHYTGTLASSISAQRAFGVYLGNKMDHTAVSLVRSQPGQTWVRLDGFATPDQLLAELAVSGSPN